MSTHGLGEPHEDDRDLYEQVIRSKSRSLTEPQLSLLMQIFYDPSTELTVKGIARDVRVSRPTAQRYRDLLLAALEEGPQKVLSSVRDAQGPIKRPSKPVLRQNRLALGQANAKIRKKLEHKRNRLTAEDTSEILDRQIRRLDESESCDAGKLKGLIDQKMKLEELANPGQDEIIDPRKVLGKEGLAGMNESFLKRFHILCAHRAELYELWSEITSTVIFTIMDDVEHQAKLPQWMNADTFQYIADIAKGIDKSTAARVSRETSSREESEEGEPSSEDESDLAVEATL